MQTRESFSTNKIIAVIAFVIAALLTSLFVFHMRNKEVQANIPAEYGVLYPVARDIKGFELLALNSQKFTQKDLLGRWTLLFFGFTHCSSVCPTTLATLNKAYLDLKSKHPNLQIVLVSLDPERDSLKKLNEYTHSFNRDFIGVTAKYSELRKLQSQFGIFSGRDPSSGDDYQLNHTASINLINPQGKWAAMFRYGLTSEELAKVIHESITNSSSRPAGRSPAT